MEQNVLTVYPAEGESRVKITQADYNGLAPFESINGTVVDFWFKFIELQKLHTSTPELADDVFFFSSFFYKKLTSAVEGKSGAEELLAQARRAHGQYGGSMLHRWTCVWITPAGVGA